MEPLLLAVLLFPAQDNAVEKLIDRLGAFEYEARERAADELAGMGARALPGVMKALESRDAEVRRWALIAHGRITRSAFQGTDLLAGRVGNKRFRLEAAGGDPATEEAVRAALGWLARHQNADGSWSVSGYTKRCVAACTPNPGEDDFEAGVTGLALLAFLGVGHTHRSRDLYDGIASGDVVRKALQWIMSFQDSDGCIGSPWGQKHLYGQSVGTLALVEAYGLSRSPLIRDQAQSAADYLVRAQNPGRGWRYRFRSGESDSSVTTWATLALAVARSAGLKVDSSSFDGARAWFDAMTGEGVGVVGYMYRGQVDRCCFIPGADDRFDRHLTMTAGAAFSRAVLGAPSSDLNLGTGTTFVLRRPPTWEPASGWSPVDFSYWHWGTLALFQQAGPAGDSWRRWNAALKDVLVKHQRRGGEGCAAGSWEPVDRWSGEGGRVYATAINALTLETCYRYRIPVRD